MLSIFVCICVIERSALLEEGRIYLYIWAVVTCMGVLVTVSWDLRMDWGLLQGNGLLKDELVYSQQVSQYKNQYTSFDLVIVFVKIMVNYKVHVEIYLTINQHGALKEKFTTKFQSPSHRKLSYGFRKLGIMCMGHMDYANLSRIVASKQKNKVSYVISGSILH